MPRRDIFAHPYLYPQKTRPLTTGAGVSTKKNPLLLEMQEREKEPSISHLGRVRGGVVGTKPSTAQKLRRRVGVGNGNPSVLIFEQWRSGVLEPISL